MKRRLFLTGAIGCGKSTSIERALGDRIKTLGGFRTRRLIGTDGHPVAFYLENPDGSGKETFLNFASGKPELDLQVFCRVEIFNRHAEAPRGDLLDCAVPLRAEAFGIFAAFAGVGHRAESVEGQGDCLVRLGRERAERHRATHEVLHD